jgi:hypothetical protein
MAKKIENALALALFQHCACAVSGLRGTVIRATDGHDLPSSWRMEYHGTAVVEVPIDPVTGSFKREGVRFNSGGFYTATTCRRMNQALRLAGFADRWKVSRRRGYYVLTVVSIDGGRSTDFLFDEHYTW